MYNILYCTEHSPTATSIQIMEKRQDVPYISVPTIKARLNYKEKLNRTNSPFFLSKIYINIK